MDYLAFFHDFKPTDLAVDPLPLKVLNHSIEDSEVGGQSIYWAFQYLYQKNCPSCLLTPLLKRFVQVIADTDLSSCYQEGYNQLLENEDAIDTGSSSPNRSYQPLKLMQTVTAKIDEVCMEFKNKLENSEDVIDGIQHHDSNVHDISFCSMKNTRRSLEDRMIILPNLDNIYGTKLPISYFAVFDGHNGVEAAAYAAAQLHRNLITSSSYPNDITSAVHHAFEKTDTDFLAKCSKENIKSGATAVLALVGMDKIHVAWAGDSQAILVKSSDNIISLVSPHKPEREDEMQRIKDVGGEVLLLSGTWRVNGNLAISRAIGDIDYKSYVVSTPEVRTVERDGDEEFLILACDGLWDDISPQRSANIVRTHLIKNGRDLDGLSQALASAAKKEGCADNITIIVVFLQPIEAIIERYNSGQLGLLESESFSVDKENVKDANYKISENGQSDCLIENLTNDLVNMNLPDTGFQSSLNPFASEFVPLSPTSLENGSSVLPTNDKDWMSSELVSMCATDSPNGQFDPLDASKINEIIHPVEDNIINENDIKEDGDITSEPDEDWSFQQTYVGEWKNGEDNKKSEKDNLNPFLRDQSPDITLSCRKPHMEPTLEPNVFDNIEPDLELTENLIEPEKFACADLSVESIMLKDATTDLAAENMQADIAEAACGDLLGSLTETSNEVKDASIFEQSMVNLVQSPVQISDDLLEPQNLSLIEVEEEINSHKESNIYEVVTFEINKENMSESELLDSLVEKKIDEVAKDEDQIVLDTVQPERIIDDMTMPEEVVEDAVLLEKIVEDFVVPEKIVEDTVVPEEVVEESVVPEKVVEDTVVPEKVVEDDRLPDKVVDETIVPDKVIDDMMVAEKVFEEEITPVKVADDMILPENVVADKILPEQLVDDMILPEKVVDDMILSEKVVDDLIVPEKVVSNMILPEKVVSNMILPEKVVDDVIKPNEIFEDVIKPEKVGENATQPEKVVEEIIEPEKVVENVIEPDKVVEDVIVLETLKENYHTPEKVIENIVTPEKIETDIVAEKVMEDVMQEKVARPETTDEITVLKDANVGAAVKVTNEVEKISKGVTNEKIKLEASNVAKKAPAARKPTGSAPVATNAVKKTQVKPSAAAANTKGAPNATAALKLPVTQLRAAPGSTNLRPASSPTVASKPAVGASRVSPKATSTSTTTTLRATTTATKVSTSAGTTKPRLSNDKATPAGKATESVAPKARTAPLPSAQRLATPRPGLKKDSAGEAAKKDVKPMKPETAAVAKPPVGPSRTAPVTTRPKTASSTVAALKPKVPGTVGAASRPATATHGVLKKEVKPSSSALPTDKPAKAIPPVAKKTVMIKSINKDPKPIAKPLPGGTSNKLPSTTRPVVSKVNAKDPKAPLKGKITNPNKADVKSVEIPVSKRVENGESVASKPIQATEDKKIIASNKDIETSVETVPVDDQVNIVTNGTAALGVAGNMPDLLESNNLLDF